MKRVGSEVETADAASRKENTTTNRLRDRLEIPVNKDDLGQSKILGPSCNPTKLSLDIQKCNRVHHVQP